eukprot:12311519-Alexandrium_andersonii.AAC.1
MLDWSHSAPFRQRAAPLALLCSPNAQLRSGALCGAAAFRRAVHPRRSCRFRAAPTSNRLAPSRWPQTE